MSPDIAPELPEGNFEDIDFARLMRQVEEEALRDTNHILETMQRHDIDEDLKKDLVAAARSSVLGQFQTRQILVYQGFVRLVEEATQPEHIVEARQWLDQTIGPLCEEIDRALGEVDAIQGASG